MTSFFSVNIFIVLQEHPSILNLYVQPSNKALRKNIYSIHKSRISDFLTAQKSYIHKKCVRNKKNYNCIQLLDENLKK